MSDARHRSRLSASVPAGWIVKESLTLMAEDGQANVIVSTEPVDEAIDSLEYASIQGRSLQAEFPRYVELDLVPRTVAGLPGYRRRLRWEPPDGVPVFQVQVYAVLEPGRALVATATTPLAAMERREAELLNILDSIAATH